MGDGDNFVRLADHRSVVDEDIVLALEDLLVQAKLGTLGSLMFVGFLRNGDGLSFLSKSDDRWRDLAGLERLRYRAHQDQDAVSAIAF